MMDAMREIKIIQDDILDAFEEHRSSHLFQAFTKMDALVASLVGPSNQNIPFDPNDKKGVPVMEDDGVA